MRLYRGLKGPYLPEEVRSRLKHTGNGTDFTDCPFTALSYAAGRNGVVLVLDVPDDAGLSVTEETWFVDSAKRLMVWGAFDRWLIAIIPGKDLRAEVRRKGIARLPPAGKSEVLNMAIAARLAGSEAVAQRRCVPFSHAFGDLALSNAGQEDRAMDRCDMCGRELSFGATISVTGRGTYCSPCYNAWWAAERGVRFDNAEFEPVILRDAKGAEHTFRIHSRLAPGAGHVMEAFEEGTEGYGYEFKVMGPEESDAMALFQELFSRMREELDRQYLKEGDLGLRFVEHDRLRGRIEMDRETHEPVLVVDGRPRSWEEIGRLLLSYEGWNVGIEILDSIEETPDVPEPGKPPDEKH